MAKTLFRYGALVAGLLLVAPSTSIAQTADAAARATPRDQAAARAQARTAFGEGVVLAEQREFALAEVKFEHALELFWAPTIAFNLAVALEEQRKLVEATFHLRAVVQSEDTDEELRLEASARLQAVESRIPTVLWQIEIPRADLTFWLRSSPQDPSAPWTPENQLEETWSDARPLNPGSYQVRVMRQQSLVHQENFTLSESDSKRIVVRPVIPSPAVVARAEVQRPENDVQGGIRPAVVIGISAAVIVVVTVIVIIALVSSGQDAAVGDFSPGSLEGVAQ